MNLDDLGREAAEEVRRQAQSIPVSVPTFSRRTRWLAPAAASAAVVILATAVGLLIRDQPDPPIITSPPTTTTATIQEPTTTTTTATTIAIGPLLSAPPAGAHIQVGLNDVTLILSLVGEVIGHVQPPLIGPEHYQDRQRRLTAEAGASVTIPEDCLVDSVIQPGASWWVVCDPETASGPYMGVLSAEGEITVIGQHPDPPAGARVFGHWREAFVRDDGVILAQFSGECEIPHAMFIIDGIARHVSGDGFWDDVPVPSSYAYGWLPDGRALVWIWGESGCGSSDPEPGFYAYSIDGSRELLHAFPSFPLWGRIVESPPAGVVAQRWIKASHEGVFGSDGTLFGGNPVPFLGIKNVAWDLGEGFIYLTEGADLRWWRPAGDQLVAAMGELGTSISITDVVDDPEGPVVVLDNGSDPIRVRLNTGQQLPLVEPLHGPVRMWGGGRGAYIDSPDWSEGELDEGSLPVPPFPLAELVITYSNGGELLRFQVGTFEQPWAVLHDFDGRRVIFSVEPLEPAAAPRTVYVIDLECPTCTEVILAGPDSFDLVGTLPWSTNEVLVPILTGE